MSTYNEDKLEQRIADLKRANSQYEALVHSMDGADKFWREIISAHEANCIEQDCSPLNHYVNVRKYIDGLKEELTAVQLNLKTALGKIDGLEDQLGAAVKLLRRYAQEDPPMGTWLASEFVRKHDGIPVAGRKGPL